MSLKINYINIYWEKIMNERESLLFKWEDSWKPINIFYYNNWYWKTTLFSFIKQTFIWNKIDDKFINFFEMGISINNDKFILRNWSNLWIKVVNNSKEITYDSFKEILENKVLNKDWKLAVAWKNPKWEQERNTVESLLRFNFFTDDEFKKYTQKSCSLINSDLDWDTKWILLNYILWEKFDTSKEALFKISYRYWARQKIVSSTKKIGKDYKEYFKDLWLQISLFEDPEKDFNDLLEKKFETKDSLMQMESIISKLDEINNESKLFLEKENNSFILNLIEQEKNELEIEKKKYEEKYISINNRIGNLVSEYWEILKWIPSNTKKIINLRREALLFIKENEKLVEEYYRTSNELLNKYKNSFLKELTNWIFKFTNIEFDNRTLKLTLKWWADEKKWDWRLKTLRFLALIWIIIYKSENKHARNLWIGFFDSPFYWVDMYNSIDAIASISKYISKNNITSQIFIFATKEEKKWKIDSFEEELKKDSNIYFHPYNYKEKEYLIS